MKPIFIVERLDTNEKLGFTDFALVEKYVSSLPRGSYNLEKVKVIDNYKELMGQEASENTKLQAEDDREIESL